MTADAAVRGIRERDAERVDRARRRRAAAALQPAAAVEGARGRASPSRASGGARTSSTSRSTWAGASCGSSLRPIARRTRTATSTPSRRRSWPPAARRGGSPAAATSVVYFRTFADYERLRALAVAGAARRGDRGRLHRLGDRGGAGSGRRRAGDDLPGAGHHGAGVRPRAVALRHRRVPRARRRGARRRLGEGDRAAGRRRPW